MLVHNTERAFLRNEAMEIHGKAPSTLDKNFPFKKEFCVCVCVRVKLTLSHPLNIRSIFIANET